MASIGIDCRFASSSTGLGTYTRNIALGLSRELADDHIVLFVKDPSAQWLRGLAGSPTLIAVSAPHYSLAEQTIFPYRIRQSGIDILFSTHFNVPLLCACPYVVTIHDLILHKFPNAASFFKRAVYRAVIGRSVRDARSIIAVSDYTASELRNAYGTAAFKKTTVIPEGVDPSFRKITPEECAPVLRRYGLESGFFLYVGNAKQHKNVQMLIDAHAKSDSQTPLLLVTGGSETGNLRLSSAVKMISNVPHTDLPALYSSARAFVTASLYEGFCLPILEARACGCPVIASALTAIPEVAGPHAMLLNPNVDAFASAFRNPPTDYDNPGDTYRWQTTAAKTAAILRNALYG